MSKDIEGFYQRVAGDPALMASLIKDAQSPAEVLSRATSKANELGYQFSVADATAWSDKQIAARASGELSDVQLEAVAGGVNKTPKVGEGSADYAIRQVGEAFADAVAPLTQALGAVNGAVADWWNNW